MNSQQQDGNIFIRRPHKSPILVPKFVTIPSRSTVNTSTLKHETPEESTLRRRKENLADCRAEPKSKAANLPSRNIYNSSLSSKKLVKPVGKPVKPSSSNNNSRSNSNNTSNCTSAKQQLIMKRHSSVDSAIHIDDLESNGQSNSGGNGVRFRSEVILNLMKLQRLQQHSNVQMSPATTRKIVFGSIASCLNESGLLPTKTSGSSVGTSCAQSCSSSNSGESEDVPVSMLTCTSDDLATSTSSVSSGAPDEYLFILDILRRIMDEIDWLLKNDKLSPVDVLASLKPYMELWSQGLLSKVSSSSSISSAALVTACNSLSSVVGKFDGSIQSPLFKDTREVATTTNLFPPNDVDVKLIIELSDSSSSDDEDDDDSLCNPATTDDNDIVPSFISSRTLKPFISKNSNVPMSFAAAAGKKKSAPFKPPVAKIQDLRVKNIDVPSLTLQSSSSQQAKKFSWAQIVTRSMPVEQKPSRKSSTSSTSSTSNYESVVAKPTSPLQEKKSPSSVTKLRSKPSVTITPRKSLLSKEKKASPKASTGDSAPIVIVKPVNSTTISSSTPDQQRLNETRRVLEMLASSAPSETIPTAPLEPVVKSPAKKSKETILQEKREILQQKLEASTQLRKEQIGERRRKAAAVVKKSKQVVERKHEISADFEFQQPSDPTDSMSVKAVFTSRIKTVASGIKYIQNLLRGIEDSDAAVNIDYLRQLYLKKSLQRAPMQKLFDLNTSVVAELLMKTDPLASALTDSTSQFLLDVAACQGQLFLQYPDASSLNRDLFEKYLTIVVSQTGSLSANKHTCHTLHCISSLCSIFCHSRLKSHVLELEKSTSTFIVKFCTERKLLDMMKLTIETLQASTEFPWPRHYLELVESFTTILSLITDIFCFEEYDNKAELFTQFSEAMKRTEFVGLVTMLNSILLHPNNNKSSLNIPNELVTASFNVVRILNNFASVDIDEFQSVIVGAKATMRPKNKTTVDKAVAPVVNPIIQTQLFHLISFFLKYCTEDTAKALDADSQNPKLIHLLHETILLIGYSVSSNRILQSMVRFGQYPVILQRLLKLPIEYLIRPRLGHIFIPTLILCCEDPDNLLILRQEVSPKYLYQYLLHNNNQPPSTELPSRFLYSKRINPSIWQKMQTLLSTL